MIDLRKELIAITQLFEREKIDYAICGGLAVAIHGYPRATKDIDILIREEDAPKAEALVAEAGFKKSAGIIPFDVGTEKERRVLRVSKIIENELLPLDLIIVTSIMQQAWSGRRSLALVEGMVSIVSKDGLAGMKRIAGRPIDWRDIENLERN